MNSLPRRHKETFHQVLYNLDDQVIVRNLVEDLMPEEVKAEILRRFNLDVDRYNAVVDQHQREDALEAAKIFGKGI
jgi:uncharacterized protein with PIN domain